MIHLENISKTFRVAKRRSDAKDVIRSFFKKDYEEVHALQDISFDINEGEIVRLYTDRMVQANPQLLRLCVGF